MWSLELTEFTRIGAHRGARGEVCQVSTMGTKVYILEMEASMVQWNCMEALKVETVMLINLAQSKKVKYGERRSWWWCRGGEVCVPNGQVQSREAVWRILVINLWGGVPRWNHSVCTHLKVEVKKAQLEMELMTSGMVWVWIPWVLCSSCEHGNSSRERKAFRGLKNVWNDLWDYRKRPKVIRGKWIFGRTDFDHSGGRRVYSVVLWNHLKF